MMNTVLIYKPIRLFPLSNPGNPAALHWLNYHLLARRSSRTSLSGELSCFLGNCSNNIEGLKHCQQWPYVDTLEQYHAITLSTRPAKWTANPSCQHCIG